MTVLFFSVQMISSSLDSDGDRHRDSPSEISTTVISRRGCSVLSSSSSEDADADDCTASSSACRNDLVETDSVFSVALLVDGHPSVDGVRVLCQKGSPIGRARLLFRSVVGCIVGVAYQTQNIQHGIVAETLALFSENAPKEREHSFRLPALPMGSAMLSCVTR